MLEDVKRRYYNTSQVSELISIPVKRLRYYNKCFNIVPQKSINTELRFTEEQFHKLRWAKNLVDAGYLTHKGIKAVINKRMIFRLPNGLAKYSNIEEA